MIGLGLTFKENCPDVRNTKGIDVISTLQGVNARLDVWNSWVDGAAARDAFGLEMLRVRPDAGGDDAAEFAVGHKQFAELGAGDIHSLGRPDAAFFDVRSVFDRHESSGRI